MKFFKILLLNLFIISAPTILSACFCSSVPFCEVLTDSSHVVEARAIKFYEATEPYSADRYIDLVITEFLYGPDTLSSDTITYVDYQSSCDLHLFTFLELGDRLVYMFEKLETREEANFSTFNLHECFTKILFIEGDSIRGLIGQDIHMAEYETFKNNVDDFCEVVVSTSTDFPVGVDIEIYPNPVYQKLHIKLELVEDINYQIFTHKGEVVLSGKMNETDLFDIDLSNFPSGSYYLQIRIKEESFIKKLVKI